MEKTERIKHLVFCIILFSLEIIIICRINDEIGQKKSIKYTTISKKVLNFVKKILSKRRYSPMLIIFEYEKKV